MGSDEGDHEEFKRRSEAELAALPDAALVAYISAAREAGDVAAAHTGAGILAWGFEPQIRAWVRKDMAGRPQDVDDVVMEVMTSAVHATFDGKVVGEFAQLLKVISQRRVADYFRKAEKHDDDVKLPNEHLGDEDEHGTELGVQDDKGGVANRDAIERVLAGRNPMHVKVIRLYGPENLGFLHLSADEVCERMDGDGETVSQSNVHQIWKRFKTDLAEELELDG